MAKSEKQQVDVANVFRQMMAQKMGISIEKLAEQDAPTIETKLGRLKYNGQMDNWSFAVFKYSHEIYDPEEFMFPGATELEGTTHGALNAAMELYP